jgi:integrase
VPPPIAAMIQLQLLTGMRPGEVMSIRTCDIDTSGKLWIYRPATHKTEHHGRKRVVYLGPKAQQVLQPYLRSDRQAVIFSPASAMEALWRERRAHRRTPMTPSQAARARKPRPAWQPGDAYDRRSYACAVYRASDRAFPPPAGLNEDERRHWRRDHRWSPNQLRHNAATRLRKEFGLEAARVVLGHSSADVTEIYAELDFAKAASVMEQVG